MKWGWLAPRNEMGLGSPEKWGWLAPMDSMVGAGPGAGLVQELYVHIQFLQAACTYIVRVCTTPGGGAKVEWRYRICSQGNRYACHDGLNSGRRRARRRTGPRIICAYPFFAGCIYLYRQGLHDTSWRCEVEWRCRICSGMRNRYACHDDSNSGRRRARRMAGPRIIYIYILYVN